MTWPGAPEADPRCKVSPRQELNAALEAERRARVQCWQSINRAREQGMSVREIATAVARSGFAGQEIVRVHLAALRLVERVNHLLQAAQATDEEPCHYAAQPRHAKAEPGRYIGANLACTDPDDADESDLIPLLRLLKAAGIDTSIPHEQVFDALLATGGVWLVASD